jgi:hypothetical protein
LKKLGFTGIFHGTKHYSINEMDKDFARKILEIETVNDN